MTEDNTTDTGQDTGGDDSESSVIKTLRQKLKDAEARADAAVAAAPKRDELEAEIRSALERESAIKSELVALGLPASVAELVDGKLDGDVNGETVAEVVAALGFQVSAQDEGESRDLEDVTRLGNQIQSAATGNQKQSIEERIAEAKSASEVAAIMAEAEANGDV